MSARIRYSACVLSLLAAGFANANAFAQEPGGVWSVDGRLRYEAVAQDGSEDADALTLRLRFGYQTPAFHGFTVLAEGEAVADLAGAYNDTVNGRTAFATIADPQAIELNRLQLAWAGENGRSVILGRQRVVLGNARFIGNVGFRQNEQTFDAVRVDGRIGDHINVTYLYFDRVRRIFGDDSTQGEWQSDSHVIEADADTSIGKIGAYALLLDFQNAPAQSSQTYGARWSRQWTMGSVTPRLTLEAARQSDYRANSASFDVGYELAEVSARRGPITGTLGWEQLDGDGVRGFSTPLATLHAFQGWADVFLTTPPDGVRDLYAGVSYTTSPWPSDAPVTLNVVAHQFSDDVGRSEFGQEFDASARFVLNRHMAIELKTAVFDGDDPRFADRTKVWAAFEFRY